MSILLLLLFLIILTMYHFTRSSPSQGKDSILAKVSQQNIVGQNRWKTTDVFTEKRKFCAKYLGWKVVFPCTHNYNYNALDCSNSRREITTNTQLWVAQSFSNWKKRNENTINTLPSCRGIHRGFQQVSLVVRRDICREVSVCPTICSRSWKWFWCRLSFAASMSVMNYSSTQFL